MYILKEDTVKILNLTEKKLVETISAFSSLKKQGASYSTSCPRCNAEHGLVITPGKGIFKCFKCGEVKGSRPVDYLMSANGMSYPDSLKWLADHFGIILTEKPYQIIKKPSSKNKKSFCSRMLAESGLTKEDVTATVYNGDENHSIFKQPTFVPGTLGDDGKIDLSGDDVIIYYYDLEGNPITYHPKDSKGKQIGGVREYFRVRWQYPEEHKDKAGRPAKYRSPYSATSNIYIPQLIRASYKNKLDIPRLYIQEGEKKAEKACKHGIPSIAVSGIQNLGINKQLPEAIAKIVEVCNVKEVVFMLDSDCFDLTSHIKLTDPIERRPKNFFYAVRNYKEYFESLKNRNIYLEIYFGHVLKNEANDKGIDDLLANTLRDDPEALKKDIDTAINLKDKKGKHVQLYKITTSTDSKIQEIWGLQSPKEFCKRYEDILKDLPEFIFGRHKWRFNENGEIVTAQALEQEEQFWEEVQKMNRSGEVVSTSYEFKYVRAFRFLQNRGFGRYSRLDGGFELIHAQYPVIKTVSQFDVRDYISSFTEETLKEDILEMIYRGGTQYLGPEKLSNLKYIYPAWETPVRNKQYFYFENCYWDISPEGINEKKYDQIHHHIWADQKKSFSAAITPSLIDVKKTPEGKYNVKLTPLGQKCQFLRFLENTSNFTWRKKAAKMDITPDEIEEDMQHLLSKLCAIGYLLTSLKDLGVNKAVIGSDGKQSEVGASNGRSGKSLVGELIKRVVVALYINGKNVNIQGDSFVWTEMTEKTKVVYIDDVRKDFDFEVLFGYLTGSWTINQKSGGRFTLEFEKSPKVYLTTNHAISGDNGSFIDRQWNIAFSDFYNEKHKPADDFGCTFFSEWDWEQWNLTWNMVAQCVQLYFNFGVVESPGERIELRRLRQDLAEEFILWADEYFSADEKRNNRISRKEMYDALLAQVGTSRQKYYTPTIFKKKIIKYCQYRDYLFNPHRYNHITKEALKTDKDGRPDLNDKANGIEYFVVGDKNYYDIVPPEQQDTEDPFTDEMNFD